MISKQPTQITWQLGAKYHLQPEVLLVHAVLPWIDKVFCTWKLETDTARNLGAIEVEPFLAHTIIKASSRQNRFVSNQWHTKLPNGMFEIRIDHKDFPWPERGLKQIERLIWGYFGNFTSDAAALVNLYRYIVHNQQRFNVTKVLWWPNILIDYSIVGSMLRGTQNIYQELKPDWSENLLSQRRNFDFHRLTGILLAGQERLIAYRYGTRSDDRVLYLSLNDHFKDSAIIHANSACPSTALILALKSEKFHGQRYITMAAEITPETAFFALNGRCKTSVSPYHLRFDVKKGCILTQQSVSVALGTDAPLIPIGDMAIAPHPDSFNCLNYCRVLFWEWIALFDCKPPVEQIPQLARTFVTKHFTSPHMQAINQTFLSSANLARLKQEYC